MYIIGHAPKPNFVSSHRLAGPLEQNYGCFSVDRKIAPFTSRLWNSDESRSFFGFKYPINMLKQYVKNATLETDNPHSRQCLL